MEDHYPEQELEHTIRHADHDLFDAEVIGEEEDLLLVHTLLDEVFRGAKQREAME